MSVPQNCMNILPMFLFKYRASTVYVYESSCAQPCNSKLEPQTSPCILTPNAQTPAAQDNRFSSAPTAAAASKATPGSVDNATRSPRGLPSVGQAGTPLRPPRKPAQQQLSTRLGQGRARARYYTCAFFCSPPARAAHSPLADV